MFRVGGYNYQKQLKGPFTRAKKKRSGSDKNSKGSDKFLRVNDTWPIPVLPIQLKKGSIGAFFGTERIKIGSVPTFSFFFPRCKRSPSFWNRSESFFPEPEILLRQPFTANLMRFAPYCALHLHDKVADKNKKAAPRKAPTKAVEPWKDYEVAMLLNMFSLLLRLKFAFSSVLSKTHKNSKEDSSIVV